MILSTLTVILWVDFHMSTLKSNTIQTVNSLDSLLFSTNATERLCISSDGNVGIGRRNPSCALDVNGTVQSTGLYCTGNMGIGTASPSVALDVVGTIKNTNPYFWVTYSTNPPVVPFANAVGELKWDTEYLDNSNSFSTTTGRFTAPVDGYYFFSANVFFTISNITTSNCYGYWSFYKNGSPLSFAFHSPYTGSSNYLNYTNTSGSHIIQLNVGDTVSIYYKGTPFQGGGYSNFSGRFIG